ncbi:hypothetical protein [Pseudomonas sp.]|uniref:hypothetical protein n=1 Tax=Pseudomonas sp. TaxID=306 RepID=UPI003D127A64
MKKISSITLPILLALATSAYAQTYTVTVNRGEATETYQGNMDTGELTIHWGKETKIFADIVGYAGQTSKTLISFNGGPALAYENAGSNTRFEIFYTLELKDKVTVIDCAYFNIRNGQNGASIRKAVCNLHTALSNENQDMISTYSDKWIEASNAVSLQSVMAEPSEPADLPLGRLGEVDVALRYSSVDDLMSATPKTIATAGAKSHEVSSGNAYFVYDADGTTPLALDVEMDPVTHDLKRLTSAELLLIIKAN